MDRGSLKRDFSWNNMAVNLTSLHCLSQTEQDIWRRFFLVSEWFIKRSVKKTNSPLYPRKYPADFGENSRLCCNPADTKQHLVSVLSTSSLIELLAQSFATEQVTGMNVSELTSIPLVSDLSTLGYCRKWKCLYKRAAVRFNCKTLKKVTTHTDNTWSVSI